MKTFYSYFFSLALLLVFSTRGYGQMTVHGKVVSASDSTALPGAVIKVKDQPSGVTTDEKGEFSMSVQPQSELLVSYIGFLTSRVLVSTDQTVLVVALSADINQLSEVKVMTGYQNVPRERVTGSFSSVDNKLLNRRISTSLMDRLEDVVPGLIFNKGKGGAAKLLIRGQSTISSATAPLIVIDNFPYEGDISTLNPNDVESVTVLKDAAAASIWGSRAGNGVIVITTKKGGYNRPMQVSLNANVTVGGRPDAFYQPLMSTADFIENEKYMFFQGRYTAAEGSTAKRAFTPVVELLIAQRDGLISPQQAESQIESFKAVDVRKEYQKYYYQKSINQQYAVQLQGGSAASRYFASAGYDRNRENLVRNGYERYTFSASNTSGFFKNKLELTTAFYYSESRSQKNNAGTPTYTTFGGASGSTLYPYARLADQAGNPLPVINQYRLGFLSQAEDQGLLDWQHRPLDELRLADNPTRLTDYRLNGSLQYKILPGLSAEVLYQYAKSFSANPFLRSQNTYFTRNEINQLTQVRADGSLLRPIPLGGILDNTDVSTYAHNLRGQFNFQKSWGKSSLGSTAFHDLSVIAGAEIRDYQLSSVSSRLYGYDDEHAVSRPVDYTGTFTWYVNPSVTSYRITNRDQRSVLADRYLSYYVSGAYTVLGRYILSASARNDQSNLFGVKTNQKAVPLYSVGAAWSLANERFYSASWLPVLKLRATFGYSGNSNKSVSAYTTASYSTSDAITGQPYATIGNPPNPNLRWERVRTWNLALDFETRNRVIYGSLEYYYKTGLDLIGRLPYPGASGIKTFTGNYANTKTEGVDLNLTSRNINRAFGWQTNYLLSFVTDKISRYDVEPSAVNLLGSGDGLSSFPLEGKPVYAVYSVPSAGLDPVNGDPRGYWEGEVSKDYVSILVNTKPSELIYNGPVRPRFFGAVRNNFTFKGFSLSVNIVYRGGHYFRSESVDYDNRLNGGAITHADYGRRWQKPGDEMHTTVPSRPEKPVDGRDAFYQFTSGLVHKGDLIRLQDINLSYDISRRSFVRLPFGSVQLYLYGNNLGILWKAAKTSLDPDFYNAAYTAPTSLTAGIKINF